MSQSTNQHVEGVCPYKDILTSTQNNSYDTGEKEATQTLLDTSGCGKTKFIDICQRCICL